MKQPDITEEEKTHNKACDIMQGVLEQLEDQGIDNQVGICTVLSSALMMTFAAAPSAAEAKLTVMKLLPWAATYAKKPNPDPESAPGVSKALIDSLVECHGLVETVAQTYGVGPIPDGAMSGKEFMDASARARDVLESLNEKEVTA